jgi:ribosomal protein L7Ae-like RNA K-turn-binding protein
MTEGGKRAFLLKLGLSRRAGEVIIGQDRIRATISAGKGPLFLLFTNDASPSVVRRFAPAEPKGSNHIVRLESVSRWELGAALGLSSTQVVGFFTASRFAEMLLEDLRREGDVIE